MIISFIAPIWFLVLAGAFLFAWFMQFLLQLTVRRKPLSHLKAEKKQRVPLITNQPGVSVIVYAHNQSEELLSNLPILLDNDYPDFEVIVVDDGSTDETPNIITQMEQRSEHFFHTTIDDHVTNMSRRKLAMMLGVKAAHNNIILMTQAQCMPVSKQWIASMVRQFNPWIDVVQGPVIYENRKGLMNRFYQWDFFERMIDMMGLTLSVGTYGGWGTNLAFRKEIFFANHNQGFLSHLNIHPGEDDLFVTEVSHKKNVAVEVSADAVVVNQQSPLRTGWKKEREMRAFTSLSYAFWPVFVKHLDTIFRYLTILLGWALVGLSIWMQNWVFAGASAALLLIHYLQVALIPYLLSRQLEVHRYWFAPLFYELITPLVNLHFHIKAQLNPEQYRVAKINK